VNLDVRRQDLLVQFFRLCLDSLEDVLGLLPAKHENDALDGIVILLETEFAEAWRMPNGYVPYITHSDGHAFVSANHDVSNVICVAHQPDAANVVELSSLRIKSSASIRVVGRQRSSDLGNGQVIPVDSRGVEQHLILHHRSTEA